MSTFAHAPTTLKNRLVPPFGSKTQVSHVLRQSPPLFFLFSLSLSLSLSRTRQVVHALTSSSHGPGTFGVCFGGFSQLCVFFEAGVLTLTAIFLSDWYLLNLRPNFLTIFFLTNGCTMASVFVSLLFPNTNAALHAQL